MPSVSKIPQNANRYAIKCAYKIRNRRIEYGKGLSFDSGKITAESKLIRGKVDSITYPPKRSPNAPKDIFVHNHQKDKTLSMADISAAIQNGVKKVFASSADGYTSIDFTTAKKSPKEMLKRLDEFETELLKLFDAGLMKNIKPSYERIKEFAKFSGATFSDVKWSDFKQLSESRKSAKFSGHCLKLVA